MRSHLSYLVILAAFGSTTGCATTASRAPRAVSPRSSTGLIVPAADLSRYGRNDTVLGALQRVRPRFLSSRGSTRVGVSIDGAPVVELYIGDAAGVGYRR